MICFTVQAFFSQKCRVPRVPFLWEAGEFSQQASSHHVFTLMNSYASRQSPETGVRRQDPVQAISTHARKNGDSPCRLSATRGGASPGNGIARGDSVTSVYAPDEAASLGQRTRHVPQHRGGLLHLEKNHTHNVETP